MYLIVFLLFRLIPRIPMQVQIYIMAVIGDIRPFNTGPNSTGFRTNTLSISHGNLKQKSRNMNKQKNAANKVKITPKV
jgi:hypothetical protein